ncbi:MAG: altronate hydrolase [Rhizomicrobium sp.]
MYQRMRDDIGIDCGSIALGYAAIEEKSAEILDYLLEVASALQSGSGEPCRGGTEFVTWQICAAMEAPIKLSRIPNQTVPGA